MLFRSEEAVAYAKSKGKKPEDLNQKWMQGWAFGRIMVEAISRAGDDLTGEGLKKAFESLNQYDLGGLGAPLTFTTSDHGGAKQSRVYQVKSGKWEPTGGFLSPKGK